MSHVSMYTLYTLTAIKTTLINTPSRGELWEAVDGGESGGLEMSLVLQSKQQKGGSRIRKRAGEKQPRYRREESRSWIPLHFFQLDQ